MSVKEAIVIVEKKDLEKLGAKIVKLEEQLGELKEAFALIAGITKPVKKTRAPKVAATEAAPTETAEQPATEAQAPVEQPAAPAAATVKAPKVTAPKAAAAPGTTPAKTVVAKAPVPTKGNGATKMAAPRMPGAH